MGETLGASGADVMLAYHIGVEVECKIAEAINPRHYQTGFHATATCGTYAAAAAAGRLMGLNVEQLLRALSIAGSQSAGLRENFGTMTKPFHAGRSSESGVAAAQFASYGWTAAPTILEAPRGFFSAAGGGYDENAIRGKLGNPWTFDSPGISIKPHPSGSLTHPGMTEMLRLIKENGIKASDVEHVRVGTNHNMPNALIHHRPQNELQAKFSMQFCMAILLIEGRAGLNEFTDEVVLRDDVKAMISKVDFVVDERAEAAGYHLMTTYLRQGGFRQGQPGQPDELRRGRDEVPRMRRIRTVGHGQGPRGRRHGVRVRKACGHPQADGAGQQLKSWHGSPRWMTSLDHQRLQKRASSRMRQGVFALRTGG